MNFKKIYNLNPGKLFGYLGKEEWVYWLIHIYLFFEYVRPQTMYPQLNILPYGQIVLIWAMIICLLNNSLFAVSHTVTKLIFSFLFVILLSSLLALEPRVSFLYITSFLALLIAYLLIVAIVNTEQRLFVFVLAFLLYNFKIALFVSRNWIARGFQYADQGTGGGPGWMQNSGEFAVEMCIFFPLALYFFVALNSCWGSLKKLFFLSFPFFAILATIASNSRGGILGILSTMLWAVGKSKFKIRALIVGSLVCLAFLALMPPETLQRFQAVGGETDLTGTNRIERWHKGIEMANQHPVFGVGYFNWGIADRQLFRGDGALSHNIFIQCMSELGYLGLLLFLLIIYYSFATNAQSRKLIAMQEDKSLFLHYLTHALDAACVGYLVGGFFVTILYYPYFWINLSFIVALNNVAKTHAHK